MGIEHTILCQTVLNTKSSGRLTNTNNILDNISSFTIRDTDDKVTDT